MQYNKKSFTVPMGGAGEDRLTNVMSDEDKERLEHDHTFEQAGVIEPKKRRHVLPFGDRILVRRRKIGEKLGTGILVAADETKERDTEIADVVFVPDHTYADKELIENAEGIAQALIDTAKKGDANALTSLLAYNQYLKIKTLQPGDVVMISKYVGTSFFTSDTADALTMLNSSDVIGVIVEET